MNINDIKLNLNNPRFIKDERYQKLKKNMQEFPKMMKLRPIIIDDDGMIIGGNMRYLAMKDLGYKDIPEGWVVKASGLTEEERRRFVITDNIPYGDWDYDKLANEWNMEELVDWGIELPEINVKEDNFNAEDEYEKVVEPKTKLGDLYKIGNHYLLCGDATKKENIHKLMNEKLARLIFTDPPYNVNYDYSSKFDHIHNIKHNPLKNNYRKMFNDKITTKEYKEFIYKFVENTYLYTTEDMSYYIWFSNKWDYLLKEILMKCNFLCSQSIIWVKDNFIISQSQDYHRMYEYAIHGWKKGKKHYFTKNMSKLSDIWNLENNLILDDLDIWKIRRDENEIREHPTQKPIKLAERALRKSSNKNDIVLDLFGGSGSTLMACEQLNRFCYIVEIDPKYCDVIIKRWENYTNQKAVKLNE